MSAATPPPSPRSASLWMATARAPARPSLTDRRRVDVAVVGAGITGLTTALRCIEAGMSVAVLEMAEIGQGVTGHTTAKVSSLHQLVYADFADRLGEARAKVYGEANQQAVEDLADVVQTYGIACGFERRDAVTWTADRTDARQVEAEARTARRLGLPARSTRDVDLPFPVAAAVVFADQAQFHPREYLLGLADVIDAAPGCAVYEHSRVIGLRPGRPLRVVVDRDRGATADGQGIVEAQDVVIATHLPFFDALGGLTKADVGGFFARVEPTRSYVVAFEAVGQVPESMSINAGSPSRSLRTYDRGGTRYLLVGGESHRPGESTDERQHWTALEDWARDRLQLGPVAYRWSAQDYTTVDGMPYIGQASPVTPHLWTATGFRKWGMTNAVAAARIITAGISGRAHPWTAAFNPSRPTLRASAPAFVRAQVDVGRHFVGDRIGLPGPEAVDALDDGDGVVVRAGGATRAVSRDGDELTSLSAVCTHLGCHVSWNTAERSWDCPCHGSRFDRNGSVIQGPATRDLAVRPLPDRCVDG